MVFSWPFKKDKLKFLENFLLSHVAQQLAPQAKELLIKQLNAVNKIQRHANGKEVCMYRMEKGKPSFDPETKFLVDKEVVKLARVDFKYISNGQHSATEVLLVNGFLFSLIFNKPPKYITAASEISVTNVELFTDPLIHEQSTENPFAQVPPAFKGKFQVNCLALPLSQKAIQTIQVQNHSTQFPVEYLDLLKFSNGCCINGNINILGIDKIRTIIFEKINYTILAEVEGYGALVTENDSNNGILLFLPFDNSNEINLGKSFIGAVETLTQLNEKM